MSETNEKRVISYNKEEMDAIENYPHNNSKTGVLMYEHKLVVDPETGMYDSIAYTSLCPWYLCVERNTGDFTWHFWTGRIRMA